MFLKITAVVRQSLFSIFLCNRPQKIHSYFRKITIEFEHECQKSLVVIYKRIYLKNYKATISLVHAAVILLPEFPSSEFPMTHDHWAESFLHTLTENL